MYKSRNQLRLELVLLNASIDALRLRHPIAPDFIRHTNGAFSHVLSEAGPEDEDWIIDAVDGVCTRHGLPYPSL